MFTLGAAFAACDSDGNGSTASDPDPGQSATARAANSPKYEGGRVRSGSLGYSAELPEGWRIFPTASLPEGQQDTYIAPEGAQLPATIQVRCLSADDEAAKVGDALTQTHRAFADVTPGPSRSVDGNEAVSVQYAAGQPPVVVDREDVLFATDHCAWTISFVTAPGTRQGHLDEFERFLSTFEASP